MNEARAQVTLGALAAAVLDDDRGAFLAAVSTRDPAFADTAIRIFDNVTDLPLSSFTLRLQSLQATPAGPRRELLGPHAVVRQVSATWRLPGDTGAAQQMLWLTFVPEAGTSRLAGVDDGPAPRTAVPLWLQERLVVRRDGPVIVLAGAQAPDVDRWTTAGRNAARAVQTRLPTSRGHDWGGSLVIEVPSSRQSFERVLGVASGSYADIAAVAWPEGPDATAALRIVVNPLVAGRLDGQALAVLITHEATHVATRSAASPAPTWLLEGFADYVAYDSYPRTAPAAAAVLLTEVRRNGAPVRLPDDDRFAPGAPDLRVRYAESWMFCRFLADQHSAAGLTRFYRAVDQGSDVDTALQTEFGQSSEQLIARWRADLLAAAPPG